MLGLLLWQHVERATPNHVAALLLPGGDIATRGPELQKLDTYRCRRHVDDFGVEVRSSMVRPGVMNDIPNAIRPGVVVDPVFVTQGHLGFACLAAACRSFLGPLPSRLDCGAAGQRAGNSSIGARAARLLCTITGKARAGHVASKRTSENAARRQAAHRCRHCGVGRHAHDTAMRDGRG